MSTLRKLCASVMLAVPIAAFADPVTVITRTSGIVYISDPMLSLIDMHPDDYDFDNPGADFALQLETTFDPDEGEAVMGRDGLFLDRAAQVRLHFTVGDRQMSYQGDARSAVGITPVEGYEHHVSLWINGSEVRFRNVFRGDVDLLGADPFALRNVDVSAGLTARFGVGYVYDNPDRPGPYLGAGEQAQVASLRVISAVPEPAHAGMLATGLLTLGALVRRRHAASVR